MQHGEEKREKIFIHVSFRVGSMQATMRCTLKLSFAASDYKLHNFTYKRNVIWGGSKQSLTEHGRELISKSFQQFF